MEESPSTSIDEAGKAETQGNTAVAEDVAGFRDDSWVRLIRKDTVEYTPTTIAPQGNVGPEPASMIPVEDAFFKGVNDR